MSACTAVLEMLPPNAHIVVPRVMYHGVLAQIQNFSSKNRIHVDFYNAGDLTSMKEVIKIELLNWYGLKLQIIRIGRLQI